METVILAGGAGSRLGAATRHCSKAMVTIGGEPILTHIMRMFMRAGHRDFIVATGRRRASIEAYFSHPNGIIGDPDVKRETGRVTVAGAGAGAPRVRLVDTGPTAGSAERLRRVLPLLEGERLLLAWCDGLADLDLAALLDFHRHHGRLASVVAVRPPRRFGRLTLEGPRVAAFEEKPEAAREWINAGLFVLERRAIDPAGPTGEMLEAGPLPRLAAAGELMAYRHEGFWDCMDTAADRERLEALWAAGEAPWALAAAPTPAPA